MMGRSSKAALGVAVLALASAMPAGLSRADGKAGFTLRSSDFKDGSRMPKKLAANVRDCGGQNVSPSLSWSNPPANTKSFAITMWDPNGHKGLGYVHWVAYDIPGTIHSLTEGGASTASASFVGGTNQPGTHVYFGPCPPIGDAEHPYIITIIALDLAPGALQPGLSLEALMTQIKGHNLGSASTVGFYSR
jgi:Raf kinase inhibitor-like YbhB/YbcL family protein